MPAPRHPTYDRDKLMEVLGRSRHEIRHQVAQLYGKGGIAVLAREIAGLIEDLGTLVSGSSNWHVRPDPGLWGPSKYKPEDRGEG